MTSACSLLSRLLVIRPGIFWNGLREMSALVLVAMIGATGLAQETPSQTPEGKVIGGYITHQSVDLGGHIVDQSGSDPMYNTLINIHTGPRILNQSLTMRAKDPLHATFFDTLSTSSFGYGGDPINWTF